MKLVFILTVTLLVTACSSTPKHTSNPYDKCAEIALSILDLTHESAVLGLEGKNTESIVFSINALIYDYNNNTICHEYTGYLAHVDILKPEIKL